MSRRPGFGARAGGPARPGGAARPGGPAWPGGPTRSSWPAASRPARFERPHGTSDGDPFAGVERVYIDGSNLLYALARGGSSRGRGDGASNGGGSGAGTPAPAGAVIGRIRAAFPPSVIVDLVFDGPPSGGITGRLATGLRVAYSGRISADRVIDEGVAAQLAADGPAGTWGILVITDDRALRDAVGAKGARTAGASWLAGRLGRLPVDAPARPGGTRRPAGPALPKAGTTIGHRRPPRPPARDED